MRFTKRSPQKCEVYKALWRKWLPGVKEKREERENYQLWELKVAHTGNCWSWLNRNDPQNIFAGSKFVVIWELEIWGWGGGGNNVESIVMIWECVCVCVWLIVESFSKRDGRFAMWWIFYLLKVAKELEIVLAQRLLFSSLFFMIMKVYIHRGST